MSWIRILPVAAAFLVPVGSFAAMQIVLSQAAPVAPPAALPEPEPQNARKPVRKPGPSEPEAEATLARTLDAYAHARSYEDEGEIATVFTGPTVNNTDLRAFSTKYVRPTRFRFEYSDLKDDRTPKSLYVIWSDEAPDRTKSWWSIRPKIEQTSMRRAIGTANGVSGGSSNTLPPLLMPSLGNDLPFVGFHSMKMAGEEAVDGVACRRIDGKNIADDPVSIWIDKELSLVRKIVHHSTIPGETKVEATTIYRPKLNVEIPPAAFEFVPPAQP